MKETKQTKPTTTTRRLPRPREFARILRPRPFVLDGTERRLAAAHTIAEVGTRSAACSGRWIFLRTEIVRSMKLLGVGSIAELRPEHAGLRPGSPAGLR
ncbi:hypothetical protein [Embleya sp. AB8]|uniref:hypothetical protein n=1 Tax=Embleya sp. AB8 TaxID=3156304 RepID=UPI003C77FEFE